MNMNYIVTEEKKDGIFKELLQVKKICFYSCESERKRDESIEEFTQLAYNSNTMKNLIVEEYLRDIADGEKKMGRQFLQRIMTAYNFLLNYYPMGKNFLSERDKEIKRLIQIEMDNENERGEFVKEYLQLEEEFCSLYHGKEYRWIKEYLQLEMKNKIKRFELIEEYLHDNVGDEKKDEMFKEFLRMEINIQRSNLMERVALLVVGTDSFTEHFFIKNPF